MAKDFEIKTTFRASDKTGRVISGMQSRIQKFAARASMALRRIDRVTGRISQGLGRFLRRGALVGAGAVGLLFHGINKTAEAMDALAKKTRAINFPIEQFQEFRFAAEQSGVSAELFDKSMLKFTKTVGEAKAGYGTMLTALKKTNPELLKQLKNTDDVSKAFELYLGAIRNTPGSMNKAALATAAFGRSGTTMINLAEAGADKLEELRAQMRQNGIVTAEQAAKAEEYNDMMNRLGLTVKGFAVDVISPLLPKLTDLADKTRQWMVENRGLIKQKISDFLKNLPGYISEFKKGMSNVLPLLKMAVGLLGKIAKFIRDTDWGYWAPKIAKVVAGFYALRAAIVASKVAVGALGLASKLNLGILNTQLGKSTLAANGLLGKLGLIGAAGAVGWTVGTAIHDHLLEPMWEADRAARDLQKRLDRLAGKDPSKQSSKELAKGVEWAKKTEKMKSTPTMGFGPMADPMAMLAQQKETMAIRSKAGKQRVGLETALEIARVREVQTPSIGVSDISDWDLPTLQTHSIEISIKDPGGHAEVTKNKKSVNLKHTGAAP